MNFRLPILLPIHV